MGNGFYSYPEGVEVYYVFLMFQLCSLGFYEAMDRFKYCLSCYIDYIFPGMNLVCNGYDLALSVYMYVCDKIKN